MSSVFLVLLLVFARVGGLVWSLPVLSAAGVPRTVRVFVSLAIAGTLTPVVPFVVPPSAGALVLAMVFELGFGLAGGWLVAAMFSAVGSASEIIAYQSGLAMASQFNPVDGTSSGVLSTLTSLLMGLVFIGADLHLRAIEIVGASFWSQPAGSLPWSSALVPMALDVAYLALAVGLQLATPVIAITFAANCSIGLLGRIAPRMNAFLSFGPILSLVGGLGMLAASLPWLLAAQGDQLARVVRALTAAWAS